MGICEEFLLIGGPHHLQVVGNCKEVGDRILKPIPLYADEEKTWPGCTWLVEYTVLPDQIESKKIAILSGESLDKILSGKFIKIQRAEEVRWIWESEIAKKAGG